ncbi:MAG: cytochrome C oxidase subunit II [Myxococcales bacterium]|nr:cytochrome C oxidase subunit II [Myxococcales bacterium]
MTRPRNIFLLAAAVVAASCGVAHAQFIGGRPLDVSLDGHRGDWLFDVTTLSVTLLFIIMVGIMLGAALLHRDKPGRKAHYETGIGRSHLVLTAVISSVIFFGVDGVLLVSSFNSLTEGFWKWPANDGKTVTVEVMAQQWGWNLRYPGKDGKFNTPDDILTWNDMPIPKDVPVMIKMMSKDVIHSFYLPNFRTKQDAVPGQVTQLWFQAVEKGEFEIGCAQHCGVNHYKMKGMLKVVEQADFNQWLETAGADAVRRYDAADTEAHWGWDWES